MKITGVRTHLYQFEMTRYLGDANSPHGWKKSSHLAVFIDTDAGVTGVTIAGGSARRHIHEFVNQMLLGEDPRGVRGLWQRMVDRVFKVNNRGIVNEALSAIDVALWDLKAKINGEPLWKTLGAASNRVQAYASGLDMPLNDDELRAYYTDMAAKGMRGGKLKVGLDPEADLRRIGIMHDALKTSGKTPALMIDSNEYWSPKQAIRHISRFEEEYDIFWAEEPARRWDYRGLAQVSQGIRAAVATGENLDHISEFMPLVDNRAVDVIEIGRNCSGITGGLQVADLAYAFEIPVSVMNCPGSFMAHFAAALPNHIWMEVFNAGRTAGMKVDTRIEDGWIILGDTPGLGIVFDEEALAQMAVADQSANDTGLPAGRRQGAGLYEVAPE
ncbi:MAG: mandelate racemase/muconate lactonizing enzyme family protein [Caldilineaceae bacterium]|nr:mandelate racemase/muconate lactonizing enzyme family protein [Caldilineaceae bacterium]